MIVAMKTIDGRTVYIEKDNIESTQTREDGTVVITLKSGVVYECHSGKRWAKLDLQTR